MTISNASNADIQTATAIGTIINNDLMPSVAFSTVSSDYSISLLSPILIPAGTLTKSFSINIVDDSVSEFSETAIITLGTPTNASLGANSIYTLIITDNDMATANFSLASQTINESSGVWADWPNAVSSWTKIKYIEIAGLNSAISNFSVLVKLDSSRINYASCQSQGQDLRFYDSSGNLLSHEIESWNSSGTSYVWVKVPSIPANPARARIWMYYGNSSASDGQDKINVWESNFKGVWHLNGNALDSTSNVKDGNSTAGVSYVTGATGQAASVNGVVGNGIRLPDSMTATNILSIAVSFKSSSSGVLFGHTSTTYSTNPSTWGPLLYIDTTGKLRGGDYACEFSCWKCKS